MLSPDGRRLVYTSGAASWQVWVLRDPGFGMRD
ncbi:MAG: PD40 domain-containing protein [Acidobacteria bacterium]|nr:PD40 domain-containing protein [Acidobacteriota bacterium]